MASTRASTATAEPRAGSAGLRQEGSGRLDLDRDGAVDCWRLSYDGGSGYGWWTMTVRAPCRSKATAIRLGGSFGEMISIARIPTELVARRHLLDGVLAHWFGADSRRSLAGIDGSLSWLLEHYAGDRPVEVRDDWQLEIPYTPRWSSGQPTFPERQVVALLTPSEKELGEKLATRLAIDNEAVQPGPFVIAYSSHNHHQLRSSSQSGDLVVHATDHAIAVEDRHEQAWSWIYVASGQDRLRTPSVGRTATDGKLVAAELTSRGDVRTRSLLIIDPRSGRSASHAAASSWQLDASGLRLGDRAVSSAQLAKLLAPR